MTYVIVSNKDWPDIKFLEKRQGNQRWCYWPQRKTWAPTDWMTSEKWVVRKISRSEAILLMSINHFDPPYPAQVTSSD